MSSVCLTIGFNAESLSLITRNKPQKPKFEILSWTESAVNQTWRRRENPGRENEPRRTGRWVTGKNIMVKQWSERNPVSRERPATNLLKSKSCIYCWSFFKHGLNLIPRGGLQVKDFQTPLCCCCPDSVIMGRFESISTWTQTEMLSGGDGAEVSRWSKSRWHVSLAAVAERSVQELRFSWEKGAAGAACYTPTCWSLPVHWENHSLWFSLSS